MATSGTTVFGAYDPLDKIADVCQRHGVWSHTDVSTCIYELFIGEILVHCITNFSEYVMQYLDYFALIQYSKCV